MRKHVGLCNLSICLLGLGLLLVLLVPQPVAAVLDFGPDSLITSNGYAQEHPAVAVGANGTIYVIWQDDRNAGGSTYDIYFAKSTDNGSTFSTPVRVDDASYNLNSITPQLALDSKGKLHAVWADKRSSSIWQIFYSNSTDGGATWSANYQINATASGGQAGPSIAINSSDVVFVVWEDIRDSNNHIYLSRSNNSGSSWSPATKIDSGTKAINPWTCRAPNDNLTVVWQEWSTTNYDIFLVTSKDGGSTFTSAVNVTKNATSSSQEWPRVAADSDSNLHVVWEDNRWGNYAPYYGYSSDGSNFSAVAVNDTSTLNGFSQAPAIAVDSSDFAQVAWQDKRSGNLKIFYAKSTAINSFGANVRIDNSTVAANCHYPGIAVDSNNVPGIVWDDNRNANLDVFYDRPRNAPPQAPEQSGPVDSTWVTNSTPTFTWTFKSSNASDSQSAYQLQLSQSSSFGTISYDSDQVPSGTSSHTPATSLADGEFYWRVRSRSAEGIWGPYSPGRSVMIDANAPAAYTPQDGGLWSTSSTLDFTWTPSTDNASGVAGYYFCLGTSAGGTEVLLDQWTVTPNFTYTCGTNGTTYYAKVKAKDNASNVGAYSASSDGITVDTSVPLAPTPEDAGQYTKYPLVNFSWSPAEDFPSGIAGYYVCIGSGPGLDNVQKDVWTNTTSYTYASGLNGVTYYAKVKAKDNASNVGDYGGNSDGVTVDNVIPYSYTPQDNGTFSNTTTLYWYWPPSFDSTSGINGYYVSIGTTYGGNETVADALTTSASYTLSDAVQGKTYYCRYYAVDNAGNAGAFSDSSDGITVDTSAPSDFIVTDDGDYTRSNTILHAVWTSSLDDISGVADYQYAVGTTPGGTELLNWTSAGSGTSMTVKNLALPNGVLYIISVRAKNGAGLWSNIASADGITVDTTVPSAGTPAAPGAYSLSASITWSWPASSDFPSGIRGYYISVGTSAGGADVMRDGFAPEAFYTYPSALNGRTYFARIRAVDVAGNLGPYGENSTGVLVDTSIPQAATPFDEGQYSTKDILVFSWSPAEDSPSGIRGYNLSIGTTPGGNDVRKDLWTTDTSYTLTGAAAGRTYYVKVRAADNAGNIGPYSLPSDGITVDTSPPGGVAVYGGGFQRDAANLSLSWSPSLDPETGIVEYRYAIGSTSGGVDVVDWTSAGLRTSLTLAGLHLANGRTYFVSVKAMNAAGLWSNVSVGGGLTVDTTAPSAERPAVPGGYANRTVVTWAWDASTDGESGVAGYNFYLGTSPGDRDVVDGAWTTVPAYSFPAGINGVTYYAYLTATDRAGNVGPASMVSDGVMVDTSLPSAYPPVAPSRYSMSPAVIWNWTPSSDYPSGMAGYYVSVGTFPGGEDVVRDQWTVSPGYRFPGGQDGLTYYIKVRARDNAGNLGDFVTAVEGVTVDLTPPTGNITIEGGAATTSRRSVMLGLESPDPDIAQMRIGAGPDLADEPWEPFARSRSWVLSPPEDGPRTVYVQFRDRAGQTSGVYSATIALDTAVAEFQLDSSAGTDTREESTVISGTVERGSRVFVNGAPVAVGPDGSFSRSVGLQEGSNVIAVTVTDPAGNSLTQAKSIWRTPRSGLLSGGGELTLIFVLALVAILLVVVVLVVGMRTQKMLAAHLKAHGAPAIGEVAKRRIRPPTEMEAKEEAEAEEKRPAEEPPQEKRAAGEEGPAPQAAAPARESAETVQMEQPGGEGQAAGAPQPPQEQPYAPYPAFEEAGQAPAPAPRFQPREGDVVIRADGSEAPAEPKLISEWSPETGQWTPVSEEAAREEPAAAPAGEAPLREAGPGAHAPEPARAMEDLARSAPQREEWRARPQAPPEAPPPAAAAAQRLSAKQIYAALYGKKAIPPTGGAAPAAPAPPAPGPAPPAQQPAAEAPGDGRIVGRARCASCKGLIPIYTAERPLRIKCPSCGQEGLIR